PRPSHLLHDLTHMARHEWPATSEDNGQMFGTNTVMVRPTMVLLKNDGYVSLENGHRGGWRMAKPLADITFLDIHQALGVSSI
ncbi:Rrf2 family transcriptional regulator, partial [Pseudomonas aeruginosa]